MQRNNIIRICSNVCTRSFASALLIIGATTSNPAYAAEVGRITLPIILSPDDARTQPQTTVQPMLDTPVDILGPRRVNFRSTASVLKEFQIGKSGKEITISPSDVLVEYDVTNDGISFSTYCKSYQKRPINGLACFADRDNNGVFDQLWLGDVTNPRIMVPFPAVKLQDISVSQEYSLQKGPISSGLQFGFSVTSAGGLANKRELHLQVTDGNEKVFIFYNRIGGPSRAGPVDATILDSQIRLYGHDSKTVTYSIEKPFSQPSYSLYHPGISRNVWIYVP